MSDDACMCSDSPDTVMAVEQQTELMYTVAVLFHAVRDACAVWPAWHEQR